MIRILCALALLGLVGCAGTATRPASGAGGALAALETAERELREARAVRGDSISGADEDAVERALAQLSEAARACAQDAGCGAERALASYQALLEDGLAPAGEAFAAAAEPALALEGEGQGTRPVELPARTITALHGRELADVIALNGPVKAGIAEWLTWMRPQLIDTWVRYRHMRHLMWPAYEQAGLPEALLFGIMAKESGGRVHAVSRAGASGPLQFMPATGLRYGLGSVGGFDTRFDPARAAKANVLYLRDRFDELGGNLELALAAYNGGEGRVLRLHRRHPEKSFWDPDVYWQLPPETREYVPMVLAAAWLFLHPQDYGLDFPDVDEAPGELRLARDTSIDELAICLGDAAGAREGWFRTLRNLNPSYMPDTRLAAGTVIGVPEPLKPVYASQCLDTPIAGLAAEIAGLGAPRPPKPREVTVRRGDSLHAIAQRHGCTVARLASANGVRAPKYIIRPGQKLALAGCSRG